MEKRKPAYKSTTLWGIIIAFVGGALPIAQAEIANMPPSSTTRLVGFIILLLGSFVGTYGRLNAKAEIGAKRKRR